MTVDEWWFVVAAQQQLVWRAAARHPVAARQQLQSWKHAEVQHHYSTRYHVR
jgi:hypothetical protein